MKRGTVVLLLVGVVGCEASSSSQKKETAPPGKGEIEDVVRKATPTATGIALEDSPLKRLRHDLFEADVWIDKIAVGKRSNDDLVMMSKCRLKKDEFERWKADCKDDLMKLRKFVPGLAVHQGVIGMLFD